MIPGTHNSGTAGELVWWQRPFSFILNTTSRCQERNITQQIADGVKLFNLQTTFYRGCWHFSHGLCIYKERLHDALKALRAAAKPLSPIYFQLYLDKNFFCGQDKKRFAELIEEVKREYCAEGLVMLSAWIEGTNEYPYKSKASIDKRENYWTKAWGKTHGKNLLDHLPLPRYHAQKHNASYRALCKGDYLMLDFYNI